ncbi:MAG: phosphatase PAP2 family protein, partial [bacterium]|nr:phosphatase PAP2 family protein [bacterium]
SGHAAFFFALAAVVGRYYPKTSVLFYAAAFSLAVSRVVAGIHWPSDILGGAVVGIAVGLLTHSIYRKLGKPKLTV